MFNRKAGTRSSIKRKNIKNMESEIIMMAKIREESRAREATSYYME